MYHAEVVDWRRRREFAGSAKWRELAFMPRNMRSRVCYHRQVKMRRDSTGSSLRQRGRALFCRCSTIGRRWCGMTLRHVHCQLQVYR